MSTMLLFFKNYSLAKLTHLKALAKCCQVSQSISKKDISRVIIVWSNTKLIIAMNKQRASNFSYNMWLLPKIVTRKKQDWFRNKWNNCSQNIRKFDRRTMQKAFLGATRTGGEYRILTVVLFTFSLTLISTPPQN